MTGKSIKTEELFIDLQQFHILFIKGDIDFSVDFNVLTCYYDKAIRSTDKYDRGKLP